MKIVTWNINSLNVRLEQLLDWLKEEQPDIVALQEIKMVTEAFPLMEFSALGYEAAVFGQKSYNGVALLSRHPIEEVSENIVGFEDDEARVLTATIDGMRIINIYAVNGQNPDSEKFQYKLKWYRALIEQLKREQERYSDLILLGDFNIAPKDVDVYNPATWEGKVLCTDEERALFQEILDLGLFDALRLEAKPSGLYTWWDYRNDGFERNRGLRIDHLLISSSVARRVKESSVHLAVRASERPSDHAPVSIVLTCGNGVK